VTTLSYLAIGGDYGAAVKTLFISVGGVVLLLIAVYFAVNGHLPLVDDEGQDDQPTAAEIFELGRDGSPSGRPYGDLQTWTRFRPAFSKSITPDRLLARLGLKRRTIRQELRTYRTVEGPAAVILPIAIYK
jgi:hypothetical protein